MNLKSIDSVQEKFREYYRTDFPLRNSLSMIDRREFGFALFEGWMLRHKSFQNVDELRFFLESSVPSDAYFSCAYYQYPEADMDQKGWLGANLVFDIDSDHIPTACDKVHDRWVCGVCGLTGKGYTPDRCPVCGGEKFEVSTWPCEVCLGSAKKEAVKLLDMLMEDFGFSDKKVSVFFSGHRGYHVQVESEAVRTLDAMARKEIVDYVSGLGLDVSLHGLSERSLRVHSSSKGFLLGGSGWSRRLALGMQNFIFNATEEDFTEIGLKKNIVEKILSNRNAIIKRWRDRGTLGSLRGIGFKTWSKIADHCADVQSAKIDTVVTTDIHRLIRLPGSLHGKTGLKKVGFPLSTIEDFDPFTSAVAFKSGAVTIFVSEAPEFRVGDEVFGPYKKQRVELPTGAAMLLVCKGRAEVME